MTIIREEELRRKMDAIASVQREVRRQAKVLNAVKKTLAIFPADSIYYRDSEFAFAQKQKILMQTIEKYEKMREEYVKENLEVPPTVQELVIDALYS